ncbi:MAG TPA: hypothetical protein VE978_28340 [Chitinophagales bacterium]|nr:hypothetical protein [Chitinophagales bacterium]
MKKIFFLMMVSSTAASQNSSNYFGISSGLNLVYSDQYPEASSSFCAGVFYEHLFHSGKWGLQAGVNYLPVTLKETKFECPWEPWFCNFPDKQLDRFQIIEFPVSLKWNLKVNKNLKHDFFIMPGYSFGFIADTSEINFKDGNREKSSIPGLTGLVKTVHFATLGFEYARPITSMVDISINSIFKITNIYDEKYGYIYSMEISVRIKYLMQ